jgi:FlaG/FlaF family flagellin (archaellin)
LYENGASQRVADKTRASATVVAVVMMFGVTVVLAGSVSAAVFGQLGELNDPAPLVVQSGGEYDTYAVGGGRYTKQVIRLRHIAGHSLDVRNIEIVVDARDACGKSGRLGNFPIPGDDPRPTRLYVEGDDIFDNSHNSVEGPIGAGGNGQWDVGEIVQFRIATSECQLQGDITVRVVHIPTKEIVISQRIHAT